MAEKTEAIGIRLDAKLKAQIQREADRQHRSVSNLVAMVLRNYCEHTLSRSPASPHLNGAHKLPKSAPTP